MIDRLKKSKYFSPFSQGTLEQQLFRLSNLVILLCGVLGLIQNTLVHVSQSGYHYLLFSGILVFGCFYYFESFNVKKVTLLRTFIYTIIIFAFLTVGYFMTGGIKGPSILYINIALIFGFLVFSNRRYFNFIVACNFLIAVLFVMEKQFPEIVYPYTDEPNFEYSIFGMLLISALVLGFIMYYFKRSYDKNRIKHEENQQALEGMNQLLRKVSDEALSATKAKSDFLASMSHEIRTPLHGIIGMADIIKKTELDEEQIDIVSSIQSSGNILLTLINDILDISKIEAERFELSESRFDIRKTLQEVLSIVRPRTSGKNVDLTFTITKDVPKFLVGDEKRLKQVLLNIAGNAAKFTNRGFVHIEMKTIEVQDDSVMMEFNVVDSGIGISEENIKNLFDPFFQGDKVRKNNYGGTGLGLAITQKIVDLMKGKISVKSTERLGTTFTIILPFSIDNSQEAIEPQEKRVKLEKIRPDLKLLVAEDFEINQKVIRMMLEKLGLKADYAENGREAVELQRRNNYDLILMDLQMPEMDGIEATRIIRAEGPSNVEPVIIAMSANALSSDQDVCFVVGMNDFISKPATLNKVHEVIKKWESPT